jgi:hypothetical protein
MPSLTVIRWRDIPAQVVVKRGRESAREQLSPRFQEAIDRAAMRAGRGSSDAYLADWQRSEPRACGDDLVAEAKAEIARLEAQYTDADLERLIRAKGVDSDAAAPVPPDA